MTNNDAAFTKLYQEGGADLQNVSAASSSATDVSNGENDLRTAGCSAADYAVPELADTFLSVPAEQKSAAAFYSGRLAEACAAAR